ncbi:MAG TPA: glycosyltransferase family 39 protein, partial [Chloroflexota bacterium]|nr:glycosyltransferase family 39 protein [Chloroflexota bacterium]
GVTLFGDRESKDSRIDLCDRGVQVGLIAALLVAVSPFLVYYSQEARMYSALATFGALSTASLWKLIQSQNRRWFVAYVVWTLALIYTQYFGSLVLAFQAIYLVGISSRARRAAALGFSAITVVGVGYLPWVYGMYRQLQRLVDLPDFWKGDFQLSYLLGHIFAAFALGGFATLDQLPVVAAGAAVILFGGVGLLAWRALRSGGSALYLLGYLIIPLALLYAVVVRDPKFTERYLIMIAPPFYLVLALSLVSFWRWTNSWRRVAFQRAARGLTTLVGLGLVAVSISQLVQIYDGPGYRKDDNRGAIQYIEQHAQAGDVAMLMMNTYQSYVYYSDGTVPWEPLQPGDRIDEAAAGLNRIAAGHRRLWVLLWNPEWADPTNWVRQSLNRAYRRLPVTQEFTGLGLELYEINPTYTFSVKTTPDVVQSVNFGNKLQLHGYDLNSPVLSAGSKGRITLYWDALVAPAYDYIVSVRLTDGRNYWWRHDDRPAAFNYPTTYWRVGQIVAGQREFEIPAGTPPGTYSIEIGVYGQGIGSDLNVLRDSKIATGTGAKIATIQVVPAPAPPDVVTLPIPVRLNEPANSELRIVGTTGLTPRVARGGSVDLTLWWQALTKPSADYDVRLSINSGSYRHEVLTESLGAASYPTSSWRSGEIIADKHRFVVPPDAPPGSTKLLAELVPHASASAPASGVVLEIGSFEVLDRQIVRSRPTGIQQPSDYQVGNFARLIGSSLSAASARPGDHLTLTIFWQALGNSGDVSFTAFAHLLGSDNLVKAQQDHIPGAGDVPTTGWSTGEYITDQYDLSVAPDTPPGADVIEVGMYDASSGQRLLVTDAAGNAAGDRIVIASVQIVQ